MKRQLQKGCQFVVCLLTGLKNAFLAKKGGRQMIMSAILALVLVIVGMVLMGLIMWLLLPSLMLIKHKSSLGYEETVAVLSETLKKKKDWQVLNVNDYQKSTADFVTLERVGSLTVCNPRYASGILDNDKDRGVTAFMPLGLGVYEDKKGRVFVSHLNVSLLGMMFGGNIAVVMRTVGKDFNDVVEAVSSK